MFNKAILIPISNKRNFIFKYYINFNKSALKCAQCISDLTCPAIEHFFLPLHPYPMKQLNNHRKIVLASQSPRRKQLLEDAGFSITVRATDVEESFPDHMPVREVPEYLAHKKALAAITNLSPDELIIASDCVVILEGVIYNKPADYHDAVSILKKLSGKMHEVITGVCIMDHQKTSLFSGVSKVFFAELSDEEIGYYIEKYQPYDKAGAYAIQEWIGLCKIKKIEGTYSNIMGLPMDLVYERLLEFLSEKSI